MLYAPEFSELTIRRNIGNPIKSIAISDERLKTAFVIRWLVAASHCLLGVGTAQ